MTLRHAWEWTAMLDAVPALPSRAGHTPLSEGFRVNLRLIDWIWHIRGSLALAPGQSSDDAFDRLDPLFSQTGTGHDRAGDTLTFQKKDPGAQDKLSVFDRGVLRIERDAAGPVLRYHLVSRILLFCFVAPLLFLAFAQLTLTLAKFQKPPTEATAASGKTAGAAPKKPGDKAAVKAADVPMNPIDKFLGAPAPEKPKKDGEDKPGRRNKKPSATPAYVFAAFFAILYVIGRILEDRLVKRLFEKKLAGS